MTLIEGFDDFITHIKNQEIRIKKQQTIIDYLKEEICVASAERDQADEYHDRFLNYNMVYIIYYVVKYKFKNMFEPQKIYKYL